MLMLNVAPHKRLDVSGPSGAPADGGDTIDLQSILRFLHRRALTIAAVAALTVLAGLAYALTATPLYTATASVLVDNSSIKALRDQAPTSDAPVSVTIDSQVEIIKSERVLLRVVKKLDLAKEPEFQKPQGLLTKLKNAVSAIVAPDEVTRAEPIDDELLVEWLRGSLDVRRVGLTNVIDIKFTSANPERSARVANAIADAYLADILEAKYEMGRRAGLWLEDRLKQLSQQTSDSDKAVQSFKTEHNIVSTGRGGLINEQQIGEISSQIILARAQVAEAKARWDRLEQILKGDASDATVTESLRNDVIVRLRQQYLEVARREAELSARYGAKHMAAVTLRTEKKQLLDNIKDELRRIAQSYKSDYEIAKLRETTLQNSLDSMVSQTQTTSQAQVKLRGLESAVQTSREVQENFLKKYMEIAQAFPVTEARVISQAALPRYKSSPSVTRITAGTAVLGLILGLFFSLGLEAMDTTFRTPAQVEDVLGCRTLGILPNIGNPKLPYRALHADALARAGPYGRHVLGEDLGSLRYAVQNPLSQFAEALRHVKLEAGANPLGGREGKVIGFCSTRPGEGKSFVAANFAELVADAGQRCILVDCDLRYPALTYMLSPEAELGFVELAKGAATIERAVWTDAVTRMSFLPAASQRQMHHPHELFALDSVHAAIEDLRKRYDYVILDLPPIIPFADVRAMTHVVDSFVFVIEWGKTSRDTVLSALRAAPGVREKLLGCLLNKADVAKLSRYYRNEESDYYVRYRSGHASRPSHRG
jgi:succinoglycan biosynthesis transport protein ExoP